MSFIIRSSTGHFAFKRASGPPPQLLEDFSGFAYTPGYSVSPAGFRLTHDGQARLFSAFTDIGYGFTDQVDSIDNSRWKVAVGSIGSSLFPIATGTASGTITAVGTNTFTDATQNWPVNGFSVGFGSLPVRFSNGSYSGVLSNTANTVTYGTLTGAAPVVGDTYRITSSFRAYWQLLPLGSIDLYSYPYGYLQWYLKNGWNAWNPIYNRLSWYMKYDVDGPEPSPGNDGYQAAKIYPKNHQDTAIGGGDGGNGFYTTIQHTIRANTWTKVSLSPQSTHLTSMPGDSQWPYDPQYLNLNGYVSFGSAAVNFPTYGPGFGAPTPLVNQHWFDSADRLWFQNNVGQPYNTAFDVSNYWLSDFEFRYAAIEPFMTYSNSSSPPIRISSVYGISIQYNAGTGQLEVFWNGPKWMAVNYNVYVSTRSMEAALDCTRGTLVGTGSTPNSAYTRCKCYATMPPPGTIYVAIQRQGDPNNVFAEEPFTYRTD